MRTSLYSSNNYDPENANTAWYKIIDFVPQGAKVLDVGCSSGRLGLALKEAKNAVVDGIDITAADIRIAQKYLNKAQVLDVENEPLGTRLGKYDVIIFADVLEHMKDPVKVLEKIKKHLTPGGRIVFSIPNMAHMFVRLQLLAGGFRYTDTGLLDYTHLHFYDEDEVRRIFREAQLVIEKFNCTTFDYPNELLQEKLNKLGLAPSEKFYKLAHEKQAVIFEYIGFAVPGVPRTQKEAKLETSPLDEVLAFVQRIKDAEASKIKALEQKIKLSEEHIRKLEKHHYATAARTAKLEEKVQNADKQPGLFAAKKYGEQLKKRFLKK